MVISAITEGLGNQLFQYAAGRALAHRLGSVLRLDTLFYRKDRGRRLELGEFRLETQPGTFLEQCALRAAAREPFGKFAAKLGLYATFQCLEDRQEGFDPRFPQLEGNIRLQGYWQSELYFQEIKDEIRNEFRLAREPDAENRLMLEKMRDAESVSLHVRRGDYVRNPEVGRIHGTCGPDYYQAAIEQIMSRVSRPVFYVFSDDPSWTRENIRTPAPCTFVTHNLGRRDVEDLRLMSHCRHHIVANSSFSWWGAWLGTNLEKQIIAPRRWFADPRRGVDMVPVGWTVI